MRVLSFNPCYSGLGSAVGETWQEPFPQRCFNPCYSGLGSAEEALEWKGKNVTSFNPCYSGLGSAEQLFSESPGAEFVSILVIVD